MTGVACVFDQDFMDVALEVGIGACTLHGRGVICLGVSPNIINAPTVSFEVLRFDDTDPQPL